MAKQNVIQEVFDLVEPMLPSGWTRLVFYAEYDESSYSIEFFTKNVKGEYTKCFSIPGINRKKLTQAFKEVDKVLETYRAALRAKELWTSMTMVVGNDGEVKVFYGYDDLSEDSYAHKKAWKKQYLI